MRRAGMSGGFLVTLILLSPTPIAAQPSRDDSLHAFMQAQFAELRETAPEATYAAAFADLNGDGREEALVHQSAGFFCGSGGCALYIYTPEGASWRQVSELTIAGAPVRALATRTGGWRDLALIVRDGGTSLPYQVRVRFDGSDYGSGARLTARQRRTPGRLLIGEDTPRGPLFR